jgi:ABC-2 type transport system ATP-binding protein
MEQMLQVEGLRKMYPGFSLVDVSFALPKGYIMGLIGPNGAGKTTVIKAIMGLIRPEGGRIRVLGGDAIGEGAKVRARIGYVCDEPRYHEDVSLRDTARAYGAFYPTWDGELFASLAAEFDLPLQKTFKKLSMGMRIKFALAMAFAHRPDLLVMDEPTSGLDPVFRRGLLGRLRTFISEGERSVLLSTHITSDLEDIADTVTFINDGRVVFSEDMETLRENWAVVRGGDELLGDVLRPFLSTPRRRKHGVEALTSRAGQVRASATGTCVVERATLEDIMYFIKKEGRNGRESHT